MVRSAANKPSRIVVRKVAGLEGNAMNSAAIRPKATDWPLWTAGIIILVACAGLARWIYVMTRTPPPMVEEANTVKLDVRQVLDVLKIVTQEVKTVVRASRHFEDWRGSVDVRIEVPVRLLYGIDLTNQRVRVEEHTEVYMRVVVPPPKLLYTNYRTDEIRELEVTVRGVHTRKGAGQTQLTLCIYENLPREIKRVARSAKVRDEVRQRCRQQLRTLLQMILPGQTWVEVRFSDEAPAKPEQTAKRI